MCGEANLGMEGRHLKLRPGEGGRGGAAPFRSIIWVCGGECCANPHALQLGLAGKVCVCVCVCVCVLITLYI